MCVFLQMKLLPHQKHLASCDMQFPFFIFWGMGSGKTIGGCVCMKHVSECRNPRVLVVCDKSLTHQWDKEVLKAREMGVLDEKIKVVIVHYEGLDADNAPVPKNFHMCIVDEAHRFRNAWHSRSARMLSWVDRIHKCDRVVFMSGTPIVHDATIDSDALCKLMKHEDLTNRIHFYNPRADLKQIRFYAETREETIECPMSWAQTFKYLMHRRQTFSLQLARDASPRTRMCSARNTYNTLLRSISNDPFPACPDFSPKFAQVLECMESFSKETTLRQVVYSSRRDTGITALKSLWLREHKSKDVFEINGSMSDTDRFNQVVSLAKSPRGVIFITDAGGQGIDFKHVGAVHIVEPSENLQEERQVINRAVRFKAHRHKNAVVRVHLYLSTFPTDLKVKAPWKDELYRSGLFEKQEMTGITSEVQDALIKMIRDDEHGRTIDEIIVQRRKIRDDEIQKYIQKLKEQSLMPLSMSRESATQGTDSFSIERVDESCVKLRSVDVLEESCDKMFPDDGDETGEEDDE